MSVKLKEYRVEEEQERPEEKGGKSNRKPAPLPYGLSNPYRNLKYESSQDYAQKPQHDCAFMNSD